MICNVTLPHSSESFKKPPSLNDVCGWIGSAQRLQGLGLGQRIPHGLCLSIQELKFKLTHCRIQRGLTPAVTNALWRDLEVQV